MADVPRAGGRAGADVHADRPRRTQNERGHAVSRPALERTDLQLRGPPVGLRRSRRPAHSTKVPRDRYPRRGRRRVRDRA